MSTVSNDTCALCYHPKGDAETCNRPDCELRCPEAVAAARGVPEEQLPDALIWVKAYLAEIERRLN